MVIRGKVGQENGEKKPGGVSKEEHTKSWGTTISGQSISTSGSVGSPSCRSETVMTTPVKEKTLLKLNHLDIQEDDPGSVSGKKKKRAPRAVPGDKSGRGLRQFSMKVCEKVESKGRTTYNEVADELVAEFADSSHNTASPDQLQYDEKNIRRRVYDALNVLMAMDIITKDKNREIIWKGLPCTSQNDVQELKAECLSVRSRNEKKAAYLQELDEQLIGLQNLIQRNEQLYGTGKTPSGGVPLPFILLQTRPNATVEVEISEDMQLVHFDFNTTPFELHDDNYVLKAMSFCGRPQTSEISTQESTANGGESSNGHFMPRPTPVRHPMRSNATRPPPATPPFPGILKSRAKYEHM